MAERRLIMNVLAAVLMVDFILGGSTEELSCMIRSALGKMIQVAVLRTDMRGVRLETGRSVVFV